jgi:hypothetical protein
LELGYPLYELTASAITRSQPTSFARQLEAAAARPVVYQNEHNRHRVGDRLVYEHFGLISVDWEAKGGAVVTLALHLDHGTEVLRQRVKLGELRADGR